MFRGERNGDRTPAVGDGTNAQGYIKKDLMLSKDVENSCIWFIHFTGRLAYQNWTRNVFKFSVINFWIERSQAGWQPVFQPSLQVDGVWQSYELHPFSSISDFISFCANYKSREKMITDTRTQLFVKYFGFFLKSCFSDTSWFRDQRRMHG